MTDKEVLSLRIMGKDISIACPPEDKAGLIAAAQLLNDEIEQIPDLANALILTSLDLAFKQMNGSNGKAGIKDTKKIEDIIKSLF